MVAQDYGGRYQQALPSIREHLTKLVRSLRNSVMRYIERFAGFGRMPKSYKVPPKQEVWGLFLTTMLLPYYARTLEL